MLLLFKFGNTNALAFILSEPLTENYNSMFKYYDLHNTAIMISPPPPQPPISNTSYL